ncbi:MULTISPECIES: hypothetical protein [unclassified Mesorhizobium]|uniref:hypothetical protein n=1 Tax=unclassified Mesorhizobium TaxID=325217 RepID=UPI0013E2F125|nr:MULTISPECIES: hypothetical protein [unclassified Mesorhizobium]
MDDGTNALLGYIIAWLPMAIYLAVYAYFTLRLVNAISRSSAAIESVAQRLEQIRPKD